MEIIQALILGIIQGLTEFLPVSSSGHLALFQNYIGNVDVGFDVVLHLATLLAVVIFFFKDILLLIKGFFSFDWRNEDFRTSIFIVIASIPIAFIGYFFRYYIYGFFSNLYVVSIGFFISGMFLFVASFSKAKSKLGLGNTFVVGVTQALALIPGISRSGSTVSTGMLLGIKRDKAIRFSFLLAIPAMLGAFILNFTDIKTLEIWPFLIGFIAAFFAGLFAIFVFIRYLKVERFRYFAYYCWFLCLVSFVMIWI